MSATNVVGPMADPAKRSRLEQITKTNFGKLMPLLVLVYIISFIDRTNIGMAKGALQADIGLSAAAYGLGAGLFFAFYALLEIPSNLILHKVGARFWIARIMITWGLLSAAMMFVQTALVPALPPQPRGQSFLHRRAARVGVDGGDVGLAVVA